MQHIVDLSEFTFNRCQRISPGKAHPQVINIASKLEAVALKYTDHTQQHKGHEKFHLSTVTEHCTLAGFTTFSI